MSGVACISRWPTTTRSPWFAWWLDSTYGSRTDAVASLAWRKSGSPSSRPSSSDDEAARPDAADADDLQGDVDESIALDELAAVLGQRGTVVAERLREGVRAAGDLDVRDDRRIVARCATAPSTTSVSEPIAFIWSLPRAFAKIALSRALASFAPNSDRLALPSLDQLAPRCRRRSSGRTRCRAGASRSSAPSARGRRATVAIDRRARSPRR